jgi:hypothetical protein
MGLKNLKIQSFETTVRPKQRMNTALGYKIVYLCFEELALTTASNRLGNLNSLNYLLYRPRQTHNENKHMKLKQKAISYRYTVS